MILDILAAPMAAPIFLSLGVAVGLLHAFEPDHIAAVSAQAARLRFRRSVRYNAIKSSVLGAFWGFGHASMILAVGAAILAFSLSIPDQFFLGFEAAVGVMLVALGVHAWRGRRLSRQHSHPHMHDDGTVHSHPHEHNARHRHGHKSYLVGCIHGLAGSGGMAALASSALGDAHAALAFLLLFGSGSIIGMTLISGALGVPLALAGNARSIQRIFRIASGTASIVIGLAIVYGVATLI